MAENMSSLLDDDSYFEQLIETYEIPNERKVPRPRNRGNNINVEELEQISWGQLIAARMLQIKSMI
jgi:hypothetical protein